MKPVKFIILAAIALPVAAVGQNTVSHACTLGGLERRVEIVYEPGRRVPCEVHYYKDTEAPGEKRVLWSAANQEGYCEQKTEEFVSQLRSWGWGCQAGGARPPVSGSEAMTDAGGENDVATDAAEVDDTGDLAPAADTDPEQD